MKEKLKKKKKRKANVIEIFSDYKDGRDERQKELHVFSTFLFLDSDALAHLCKCQ